MLGNKKLLGLFVLVVFSATWLTLEAKRVAKSEKVATRVGEDLIDDEVNDDATRLSRHKRLIYKDTDLIIRDSSGKTVFQVLSAGRMDFKHTDGKKSLFTVTSKDSKVEVGRGKMKVGATELNVSSGDVIVGGDMNADGDVIAGGSIKTNQMAPNLVKGRVDIPGSIEITEGLFKFGPPGLECIMDASTGKINVPGGMYYGKDSLRFQRQIKFNNPLPVNSKLTLMEIPVPDAAADQPFTIMLDFTYLADVKTGEDFIGSGYAHVRYFMYVLDGDFSYGMPEYDFNYLGTLVPNPKIVKLLAPTYSAETKLITVQVSNTSTESDTIQDLDVTDFTSTGTLDNQFVHFGITMNKGVADFDDTTVDVEHDDDQEPEDEDEDEDE